MDDETQTDRVEYRVRYWNTLYGRWNHTITTSKQDHAVEELAYQQGRRRARGGVTPNGDPIPEPTLQKRTVTAWAEVQA